MITFSLTIQSDDDDISSDPATSYEVDVRFTVEAGSEIEARDKLYNVLVVVDAADEGRNDGHLPMWQLVE